MGQTSVREEEVTVKVTGWIGCGWSENESGDVFEFAAKINSQWHPINVVRRAFSSFQCSLVASVILLLLQDSNHSTVTFELQSLTGCGVLHSCFSSRLPQQSFEF